ncbi:hypothetical protein AAC387_Pa03g2459 [Persea americana]
METHLQRNYSNVPVEGNRPSCMWGVFHIFHFPHWFYARKTLPDKKPRGGRQAGGVKIVGAAGEGHDADVKGGGHHFEKRKKVATPTRKKSGKRHIKTLIAEEMSKEQEQKHTQLMRTDSIHHLECMDYVPNGRTAFCKNLEFEFESHEKSTYNRNPLLPKYPEEQTIFNKRSEMLGTLNWSRANLDPNKIDHLGNRLVEKQALVKEKVDEVNEAFLEQQLVDCKGCRRDASLQPSKELSDAIDVLNGNRELFLKILKHPNSFLAKHVRSNSNPEALLTKCGSFPATEIAARRAGSLSTLKKKQQEILSCEAGTTNATQREDSYSESVSLNAIESAEGGTSLTETKSTHELKKQKESGKVMNRLKDIKQRIKHAIKESKRERLRISMDGILHKIPYGRKASKNAKVDMFKDGRDSAKGGHNSNIATSTSAKGAPMRIRRTPSLSESLEKYSQLLESISSKDTKGHLSERSKFANEDGTVQHKPSSRTFQRIFSMPESGSYFLGRYMDVDVHHDMLHRRKPSRILEDSDADVESYSLDDQKPVDTLINTDKCMQLGPSEESESQENYMENTSGSLDGDQERLETEPMENASYKVTQASPVSVLNSCIPEDITSPTKVSISEEGSEIKPRRTNLNGLDHFANLQDQPSTNAPDSLEIKANIDEVETPHRCADSNVLHVQADGKDDAYFNYVSDVLKMSGFSGNELLGTWHSPDQPVDPSLFDEVEGSPHKLDITEPEAGTSSDFQLLFDLINEVLLEIYERSFTSCPWHLCFNSNTRPIPVGYHVLEEVWATISWHLSSQPQLHPSLEYVVSRDLAKNDGWMHLQEEAECVGLEFEEWILDDLLDEVTFELAGTCKH